VTIEAKKTVMLDELVELTGSHRDYARSALRCAGRDELGHGAAGLAAGAQHVVLAGHDLAAGIVAELANSILALDRRVKDLDTQLVAPLAQHPQAEMIQSMPGFGPVLGVTLLVAAIVLRVFPSAGHVAAAPGLVPVPNDSTPAGDRATYANPGRSSRPLRHLFYLSARTTMMRVGPNRDHYLKKRRQGRTHAQATIALAR